MASMSLSQLAHGLVGIPPALANKLVSDLTLDSRQVAVGNAFIAIQGAQTDGHRFIDDALDKGA